MSRKDTFIKGLAEQCKPVRPLPLPSVRAFFWFIAALAITVGLTLSVQVFRPGMVDELQGYPLFLMEVLSGIVLVPVAAYMLLALAVPGNRIPLSITILLASTAAVFLYAQAMVHSGSMPESTMAGKRSACWVEVVIYGAFLLTLLHRLLDKAMPRFRLMGRIATGLTAGLLPAVIMEIACLYDPHHQLTHHYAPILVLMAASVLRRLKKTKRFNA